MGETDNRKPATFEQIGRLRSTIKLTLESSYHELYVDMVLMEGLNRGMMDSIINLDKEYVSKVLRVHANVCYAILCLCTQMRSSLKAQLDVEKRYIIRRSVVTAHEMYKYLYGFNGKPTLWHDIESQLQLSYPEKCVEIADNAERYRNEYAQVKDGDARDVAKHYSNNPEEFYERMANVSERNESDRIVALMSFLQPIHAMLVEELRNKLGLYYLLLWREPMPKQTIEHVGIIEGEKLETFKKELLHYDGIVNGLFRQICKVREIAGQFNLDVDQMPEWAFLVRNNMVAHILYIYLDLTATLLAFTRSETFAEYQQNLAYLFLSAHEGFKKLYGFSDKARDNSFWRRSVKAELDKLGDDSLSEEVKTIEKRLDRLSQSVYLKDEEKAVVFSHIGKNKKAGEENAIRVIDYFVKPVESKDLKDLTDFLFLMNDIVRLVNKVLSLQSAERNRRLREQFNSFRQMFDKIDAVIAQNLKEAGQMEDFNENTKRFRTLIDDFEDKVIGQGSKST